MLTWLLVTFGVSIGSSIVPFLSIEIFTIAMAAHHPRYPVLLFGAVIAIGQVIGKLLYFYAARGSLHLPGFMHRQTRTAAASGTGAPAEISRLRARWRALIGPIRTAWIWLRDKCHAHPRWMVGATATSALLGVPPFLPVTVLAGLAGLSLRSFILAALPGRFIRFTILASSPAWIMHWLPFLHHHH